MECFHSRIVENVVKSYMVFPFFDMVLWLSRNKMVFQGLELNPTHAGHKRRSARIGN